MSHDVFISYSHKDHKFADAVCTHLEANKIRCWIAPRDIEPGQIWAEAISDSISESKVIILLFSQSSNSSKQVLREVELAVNSDVVIVPFKIDDVNPTGGMSYYLSTTHWIDMLHIKTEDRINFLYNKVRHILEGSETFYDDVLLHKKTWLGEMTELFSKSWKKIFLSLIIVITILMIGLGVNAKLDKALSSKVEEVALPVKTDSVDTTENTGPSSIDQVEEVELDNQDLVEEVELDNQDLVEEVELDNQDLVQEVEIVEEIDVKTEGSYPGEVILFIKEPRTLSGASITEEDERRELPFGLNQIPMDSGLAFDTIIDRSLLPESLKTVTSLGILGSDNLSIAEVHGILTRDGSIGWAFPLESNSKSYSSDGLYYHSHSITLYENFAIKAIINVAVDGTITYAMY